MQRLADQVSAWFVPAVLLAALATFIGWMAFGPDADRLVLAIGTTVAVLIIACPCALGLARRRPSWWAPARPPSSASSSATAGRWRPRAG